MAGRSIRSARSRNQRNTIKLQDTYRVGLGQSSLSVSCHLFLRLSPTDLGQESHGIGIKTFINEIDRYEMDEGRQRETGARASRPVPFVIISRTISSRLHGCRVRSNDRVGSPNGWRPERLDKRLKASIKQQQQQQNVWYACNLSA